MIYYNKRKRFSAAVLTRGQQKPITYSVSLILPLIFSGLLAGHKSSVQEVLKGMCYNKS
jgi:hypothetical protein